MSTPTATDPPPPAGDAQPGVIVPLRSRARAHRRDNPNGDDPRRAGPDRPGDPTPPDPAA